MIHQTVYLLLRLCTAVAAWMAGKYHQLRERGAVISGVVVREHGVCLAWLCHAFVMTPLTHNFIVKHLSIGSVYYSITCIITLLL